MRDKNFPTVREFERALKTVGFSRMEIAAIMHEGYIALVKKMMPQKPAETVQLQESSDARL
jgi:hypothetical protein